MTSLNRILYVGLFAGLLPLMAQGPQITNPSLPIGILNEPYPITNIAATGGTGTGYSFFFTSTNNPQGLTLSSAGQLSGTPFVPGNYPVAIGVLDSGENFGSRNYNITITSFYCPSSLALVGQSYSSSIDLAPFVATSYVITNGKLPEGLVTNSGGQISGTSFAAGVYPFTVNVADAQARQLSRNCSITVQSELQTSSPRTTARYGKPYRSAVSATGGTGIYSHSIVSGSLPVGLTLESSSGRITGTPDSIGPSNFRVRTQDTGGRSNDMDFTIYVLGRDYQPELRCSLPSAAPNRLYSSSLSLNGPGNATYGIVGTLPLGLTLNPSTGAITGVPTNANFSSFTATATGVGGTVLSASCSISVAETQLPYLEVACPDQNDLLLREPYASPAIAVGGVRPYTFSLYQSSLPAGLTLNPATGLVSGMMLSFPPIFNNFAESPLAPQNQLTQTFYYSIAVTDGQGNSTYTSQFCFPNVSDTPVLTIPPTTLPPGVINSGYSTTILVSGGVQPLSVSSNLPTGLQAAISGNTVTISGTIFQAGSIAFRLIVRDSALQTAYRDYVIPVGAADPLRISSNVVNGGTVGINYSESVSAEGGVPPYRFGISGGTPPPGITFSADGSLRGTPTTAGTFRFDAEVLDSSGARASRSFAMVVFQGNFRLGCPNLQAEIGVPYSSPANVIGGSQPYLFSIASGQLPGGFNLDSATGTISGRPTTAGAFIFTFGVSDARQARTQTQCSIGVLGGALRIITEGPVNTKAAENFQGQLEAASGTAPYQWTLLSAPADAGLTVAANGSFTGRATKKGVFAATVQARDAAGATANKTISIVATDSTLTLACPTVSSFQLGATTSGRFIVAGGLAPYNVTLFSGTLPPGFELSSTGPFTVRPSLGGTYAVQMQAVDSTNTSVTTRCSFEVTGLPLIITTDSLGEGRVGTLYSAGVSSSGGVGPVIYGLTSGGLPAGLEIDSSNGNITGTPETAGTFAVGVGVTDELQRRASRILSLRIEPGTLPFRITTASPLSDGFVGRLYQGGFAAEGGKAPYAFTIGGLPPGITASGESIGGTPATAGDATVSVSVRDAAGATVLKSFLLRIKADGLTIVTDSLPDGTTGQPYTTGLTREGGRAPFTWTIISGSMPDGLVFNPLTGGFEGTPSTTGQYNVTVEVKDATGSTSRRTFALEVRPEGVSRLSITTATLPDGNAGVAYSTSVGATGGRAPFSWSLNGDLPAGLSLAGDGTIAGTPQTVGTASFLVTVVDSLGLKAARVLSLRIGTNAIPGLSIDGLPDTANTSQSQPFTLRMASAFGVPVSGRLTLTFVPDSIHGSDDPANRFANGSRTFDFTVAAGSTTVVHTGGAATISIGTLAGTIRVDSVLNFAGTSAPGPTRSIAIARTLPVITNLSLTRNSGGLEIRIEGFTNTRQLTEARVTFTASGDVDLTTASQVTVNVASAIQSWFASAASQPFGGRFALTLPFTVSGNTSGITGVSVVIVNGQGTSAPATAN